jgi:hypothetical protein
LHGGTDPAFVGEQRYWDGVIADAELQARLLRFIKGF